jgi:hypothetical protein
MEKNGFRTYPQAAPNIKYEPDDFALIQFIQKETTLFFQISINSFIHGNTPNKKREMQ